MVAHPFVFRSIIPAIMERRPDLKMSPIVREGLAQPEDRIEANAPAVLLGLVVMMAACVLALMPTFQNPLNFMMFVCLPAYLAMCLGGWGTVMSGRSGHVFVKAVLICCFVLPASLMFCLWGDATVIYIQTVAATELAACALALGVAATRFKITIGRQVAIAVILLTAPFVARGAFEESFLPVREIEVDAEDDVELFPFWGRSGEYLTSGYGAVDFVIDLETLKTLRLPRHGKASMSAVWLDSSRLVRRDRGRSDPPLPQALFVYDFEARRETKIRSARNIGIGGIRPVSMDGKVLVWVEHDEDGRALSVKFWNLAEEREEPPQEAVPALTDDVRWATANWASPTELVFAGREGPRDARSDPDAAAILHLIRFDVRAGTARRSRFELDWSRAYPTDDFLFAFLRAETEGNISHRVDLLSGKVEPLPDWNLSHWILSGHHVYALCDMPAGRFVRRVDIRTGRASALHEVPRNVVLVSVSRTNRFAAFFYSSSFPEFAVARYRILDLQEGVAYETCLPGMLGFVHSTWESDRSSPWSRDDQFLLISSFGASGKGKVALVPLPRAAVAAPSPIPPSRSR